MDLITNGHDLDAEAIKKEMAAAPVVVVTPFYDLDSALTVDTAVTSTTEKRASSPASSEENFLTPPAVEKNERLEKPASPVQVSPNNARPVNVDFLKIRFRKTQSVSPPSCSSAKVNNGHRASVESSKSVSNGHVTKKPPAAPKLPAPQPTVQEAPAAVAVEPLTSGDASQAVTEPSEPAQPTPETDQASEVTNVAAEPEKMVPDTTVKAPEPTEPKSLDTETPMDTSEAPKPVEAEVSAPVSSGETSSHTEAPPADTAPSE